MTNTSPSLEQTVLAAMNEAVISCDIGGRLTYINRAAEQLIGLKKDEMLNKSVTSIVEFTLGSANEEARQTLRMILAGDLSCPDCLDSKVIHCNGKRTHVVNALNLLRNQAGSIVGAVMVMRSADRHYRELHHQANYDWLTDLPNRALLTVRLNLAVSLAIRHNHQVGLLFVDVDHFKQVNDSLGHEAGDQLLKSVARRLVACVRSSDTVSRHGGDEFAILLTEIVDAGDCEKVAKKILNAFTLSHQLGDTAYVVGLSIGISIYPIDADCSQRMYLHADEAMYRAKNNGRNNFILHPGCKFIRMVKSADNKV